MVCVNPSLKRQGNGMGTAWEQHGMCESVFKTAGEQQGNGMGTAWERHVCVNRPLIARPPASSVTVASAYGRTNKQADSLWQCADNLGIGYSVMTLLFPQYWKQIQPQQSFVEKYVTTSNKFKQLAKHFVASDIYGFANGDFEVYCLLGCDTPLLYWSFHDNGSCRLLL
jgi:hypothetical protein